MRAILHAILLIRTIPRRVRRSYMTKDLIHVAIDGPAGAGKSTIAKIIAERLNILYVDTGAMYRALTWKLLSESINLKDIPNIVNIAINTSIKLDGEKVFIDGLDVTEEIRLPKVSNHVSIIARIPEVRTRLVEIQRDIAKEQSLVMDGRDIGTYVLPSAKFKFFLTATAEERANRRYIELIKKGINTSLEQLQKEIKLRDKMDSERIFSPLKPADDAIIIDTTSKSILFVSNEIMDRICKGE